MYTVKYLVFGIILFCVVRLDGIQSTWRYSTACYGSDPACSGYTIECGFGERIVIGSLKYGGKSNPNRCQFGIADCQETLTILNVTKTVGKWCCTYDPRDYLKDFTEQNRTTVVTNCNGRQKCSGRVPRIFDFSYSSYVRMQYACIKDNSIEMCSNVNKSGLDMFITFNLSNGYSFPSLNGSRDCTCQVRTLDCSSKLELELVAMNLSQKGPSMNLECSNAYLDLTPTEKLVCDPRNKLAFPVVYTNVSSPNTIALRHLFVNGSMDKPGSVVIRVRAVQMRSPVYVECYQPGVEPLPSVRCLGTTESTSFTSNFPTIPSPTQQSENVTVSTNKTLHPSRSYTTVSIHSSQSSDVSSTIQPTASQNLITDTSQTTETAFTRSSTVLSNVGGATDSATSSLTSHYITSIENNNYKTSTLSSSIDETYYPSNIQSYVVTETTSNFPDSKTDESIVSTTHSSENVGEVTTEANEIVTPDTGDNSNTTALNSVEQSNTFTFSVVVPHEAANSSNRTGKTIVAPATDHTTMVYFTTKVVGNDVDNKGLIIGLTVGAVLVVILVAAVVALCCFIRLKKKEKVERNYVRNTNIFYSFPEEYYVTENMSYEPAELDTDEIEDLRTTSRVNHYDTVDRRSPSLKRHQNGTTLYMDNYKIKQPALYPAEYQKDAENSTVVFVNGTQPETTYNAENEDVINGFQNGTSGFDKSVSFDPSSLYSKVKKEGKTKF